MRKTLAVLILASVMCVGIQHAVLAQTGQTAAAEGSELKVQHTTTLWDMIKSGGWAMYPLGACSFITVSLAFINFQRVNPKKLIPPVLLAQMKNSAANGDANQLWQLASSTSTLFTTSLAAGLKHFNPDDLAGCREKMEAAISETAGREESRYGFYVNFLALMTSMSPMWGLLGTVSGMIGAFSKIGAGGMGKPELLAQNIGEALVCTASGLLIAISAMGLYFFFRNVLNTTMKEAEGEFTDILDSITGVTTTRYAAAEPAAAAEAPASK
ncbi:MAG: MotA/TolQ/ExbB proton channel family protein [bacterium]